MFTIIGCGNSNRSDDGVGVVVAQRLQRFLADAPRSDVRVFDAGTSGVEVMFMARGSTRLVIIDASRSGAEPGAIFEVPGATFDDQHVSMTLHDFRWDHALHAGRRIFKEAFPKDVTVLLVESQSLELGLELTPAVARAADQVEERVRRMIAEHATVRVRAGNLYLDAEVIARFYPGVEAVALLEREGAMWILPVRSTGGGGLLLKVRNARGDRVAQAVEFMRMHDIERPDERSAQARWDAGWAALVVELAPLREPG